MVSWIKHMEADLSINNKITIPGSELIISVSKSSGPGGQHVNKTSSKVSLRWNLFSSTALSAHELERVINKLRFRLVGDGDILIHVDSERSQLRNREIAKERLAKILLEALKPIKKRVASKPTLGSKNRRIETKKKRGVTKKLRNFLVAPEN